MYVVYGMFFLMLKHFVGSTNTIKNIFNSIDIYSFIPVSVCVGRGPVHYFDRGPIMAVKTALSVDKEK